MKDITLIFLLILSLSTGYAEKPQLSFFCELQGKEFSELFADSALISQLLDMHASLRIGLHDFSLERTQTIKKINQAGIPIIAWLLLPEKDGYWFNMYNGEIAEKRYDEFKHWTDENQIKWAGLGIDLEPDINDIKLALSHRWKFAWKVYRRLYDNQSLKKGQIIYQALITKMRKDGFTVESYIIPWLYEERETGTTSFQKLLGIVDIETDKEIPMLYTSMTGNPSLIQVYHRDNQPIALGSTGGGINIDGIELASLGWDKLQRDLLIASKLTDEIHIFCLETSVQQNLLEKISSMDFNQEAPDIHFGIVKQKKIAAVTRFILKALNHPFLLTVTFFGIVSLLTWGIVKLISIILRITGMKRM